MSLNILNTYVVVEILAVVQGILERSSLEEIDDICIVCKIPSTMMVIHSCLLGGNSKCDNTENNEH